MPRTAPVQIPITAQDRTRAAFAAAQRRLDGLTGSGGRLAGLFRSAGPIGVGVASLGLIFAGAARAIGRAVNELDELDKASQRAGTSVEELQGLQQFAELGGVAVNQTNTALQRFTRRLGEAANGTGTLSTILEEMNINVRDAEGNIRPTIDVLSEFQTNLQGLSTQAEISRASFAAFDTEGVQFGIALANASGDVRTFVSEAEQLNRVVSQETVANAVAAKDSFTVLGQVLRTQTLNAVAPLADEMREAADSLLVFLNAADDATLLRNATDNIGDFSEAIANARTNTRGVAGVANIVEREFGDLNTNINNALGILQERIADGLDPEEAVEAAGRLQNAISDAFAQVGAVAPGTEAYETLSNVLSDVTILYNNLREQARDAGTEISFSVVPISETLQELDNVLGVASFRIYASNLEEVSTGVVSVEDTLASLNEVLGVDSFRIWAEGLQDAGESLGDVGDDVERLTESLRNQVELQGLLNQGRTEEASLLEARIALGAEATEQEVAEYAALLRNLDLLQQETEIRQENIALGNQALALLDQFQDSAQGWLRTLGRALAIWQQFREGGGEGIGDFFSALGSFGGGRQQGGRVTAGTTYLVGERGPELFTPNISGGIIPGVGGTVSNQTLVINTTELRDTLAQVVSEQAPTIFSRLQEDTEG